MSENKVVLLAKYESTGPVSVEIRNPLNYCLYSPGMASSERSPPSDRSNVSQNRRVGIEPRRSTLD